MAQLKPALKTLLLAAAFPLTSAQCSRESLLAAANSYIAAVAAGKVDTLPFDVGNFTYKENNKVADIKKGALSQALKIDISRSTADSVACASYTMLIASSGTKPYVIGTQIRHPVRTNGTTDTSKIALVDTIAATKGDLFFDATKTLTYIKAEDWTAITDEGRRPSRELLKKVGDGYLDMWTDAKAADSLPWGTDCERVEGSQFTRPCGKSLPRGGSSKVNGNRRYVIDEVYGSVDVLCAFDSLGNYPDSHEIRVIDGKVKYVHTITVNGK